MLEIHKLHLELFACLFFLTIAEGYFSVTKPLLIPTGDQILSKKTILQTHPQSRCKLKREPFI